MPRANWKEWDSTAENFSRHEGIPSYLVYGTLSKEIPEVSIMVLTYRRAEKLERALNSALSQDFRGKYEIIVVDDCPYDEATDVLMRRLCSEHSNLLYYRNEKNLGQYANWNRAAELCRTKWFCLLHNDDYLMPDYLSTMTELEDPNIGLIGTYFVVKEEREDVAPKRRLLDVAIDTALNLSKDKLIPLTLRDNIKHIFTFSCCLFINREKYFEAGGLNEDYYPSSDFVFSSKMNTIASTAFYPNKMSVRTVGDNVSLRQEVCDDSIRDAYHHTFYIAKSLGFTDKKAQKLASRAAVFAEIGVKGYNDVDYGGVKKELGMSAAYNNSFIIFLLNLYSKFNWGLLFLRPKLSR